MVPWESVKLRLGLAAEWAKLLTKTSAQRAGCPPYFQGQHRPGLCIEDSLVLKTQTNGWSTPGALNMYSWVVPKHSEEYGRFSGHQLLKSGLYAQSCFSPPLSQSLFSHFSKGRHLSAIPNLTVIYYAPGHWKERQLKYLPAKKYDSVSNKTLSNINMLHWDKGLWGSQLNMS